MANLKYVNRLAGPIEIKNRSDENLKIILIDPDGYGPEIKAEEEISIEKSTNSFKINTNYPFIVSSTNGDIAHFTTKTNNGTEIVETLKAKISANGVFYGSGFQQTSSRKYKENIEDIDIELLNEFFDNIEIKTFDYNHVSEKGISLIIEDCIEKGLPFQEYLFSDNNGELTLNINSLLGLAIAAIKEERNKRKELEKRIERLEKLVMQDEK